VTHTTEDISPVRKAVTLTVSAETLAGYEKEISKGFVAQVRLPGFRPGKAPVDIVKRQFAKGIAEELRNKVLSESFKYLTDTAKLEIYGVVKLDGLEALNPAAAAVLKLEVDLKPTFELPAYKDLALPLETPSVSEEEVQKALDSLRSARSRFEVVDRAAEKGDYVKLSYTGTIDGTPVKDIAPDAHLYGTQNVTWEEAAGEDAPGIPEIVTGIVGNKAGDKATFTHAFPDDDTAHAALRGKTASYEVEVFEVRSRILPELNEEFFKDAKATDLEDLKKQLREQILKRKENEASVGQRQKALELLRDFTGEFAIPESAIDQVAQNIFVQEATRRLRAGADIKEIEASRDEDIKQAREPAIKLLRGQFILTKIAEAEKLAVTREELSQRIAYEAYAAGSDNVEKFARDLAQDRERLGGLQLAVLQEKALTFVVENAKK
jgi:trigger factor